MTGVFKYIPNFSSLESQYILMLPLPFPSPLLSTRDRPPFAFQHGVVQYHLYIVNIQDHGRHRGGHRRRGPAVRVEQRGGTGVTYPFF